MQLLISGALAQVSAYALYLLSTGVKLSRVSAAHARLATPVEYSLSL